MKVVAVADTDSYSKWAASLLAAMPDAWQKRLVLLATPLAPSADQLRTALLGTGLDAAEVPMLTLRELKDWLAIERPDLVVASTLGSVAELVLGVAHHRSGRDGSARDGSGRDGSRRPVLVTGLPGIGVPVRKRAITHRSQADLFVVHSRRERREFHALAAEQQIPMRFGLATLPFLPSSPPPAPLVEPAETRPTSVVEERPSAARTRLETRGTDVVFAAQAIVPAKRPDRIRLLKALAALATSDPTRLVVIKLRARPGEQQTHRERDGYDELLAELPDGPANLVLDHSSMADALDRAGALVTVSSTAALEAIARGLPVLALDDFGVGPTQINEIFEDSGLFGSLEDLAAGRFGVVNPGWLDENYFHGAVQDDWLDHLDALNLERERGGLPVRPFRRIAGGALGRAWRRKQALGRYDRSVGGALALVVGSVALPTLKALRRLRKSLPAG
ncbi:DUF6716 putative glycosyltransferase [Diaminobutyricimonas sp. TR449]|uniref:DUF6716 putative glycosyltransferase n=1 Tax=Diaminobutyricimonas sp. TR449 TaxID=2708076 RepID=UPI00141EABFB|nr:DUF6716 putative glycosyltransferase [Diaminobutyricimonas sp. TR449]